MICPKCRNRLTPQQTYCPWCHAYVWSLEESSCWPRSRPMSKVLYLYLPWIAVGVFALFELMLFLGFRPSNDVEAVFILPQIIVIFIFIAAVFLIHIYKIWSAIQDGHARTGPGRAVFLMFIPFFNLYWMFQAVYGFAKDYNALIERYGLYLPHLPLTLYLNVCIVNICCVAVNVHFQDDFVLKTLIYNAEMILDIIVMARNAGAVNRLAEARARVASRPAAPISPTPAPEAT